MSIAGSKKHKEPLNCKIRKKVSFNLNVQSYEPISKEESTDYFWESEEEEKKVGISKETAKEGQSPSRSDGDSIATIMVSYPSNYRYRNCVDCYDEEDEIAYEESDLDDDDDDDSDEDEDDGSGGGIDDVRISQEELSEKFMSLSVSSNKRDSLTEFAEEKSENMNLNEGGLKSLGMNRNARTRSQYVYSVLNPVENLSQWKAVKAKGMPPVKRLRKENVALEQQVEKPTPQMQEIAVDASLSNWLFSSDTRQPRATSITKSSTTPVQTVSSKTSSFGSTFSGRVGEDMPILDITNLEA